MSGVEEPTVGRWAVMGDGESAHVLATSSEPGAAAIGLPTRGTTLCGIAGFLRPIAPPASNSGFCAVCNAEKSLLLNGGVR